MPWAPAAPAMIKPAISVISPIDLLTLRSSSCRVGGRMQILPMRAGSALAALKGAEPIRALTFLGHPLLVVRSGDPFLHFLLVLHRKLCRPEIESQLVDLAIEVEGHPVILVV